MRPPVCSYLTDVYFGFGAVADTPEVLAKLDVLRPLVITDAGLVKLGYVQRLGLGAPAVFDRVETNPGASSAREGLRQYREHACDGIVALGGGSPIDLAKIVALLVNHAEPLEQYAILNGGVAKITARVPAILAVPTTAGSGSEVGRAALLTFDSGEKLGFLSPHLLPKAALCDPELTLGLPPALTAGTGMDALSHCVETFLSTRVNPVADAIALEGFARGISGIRTAVHDGSNRVAREQMMWCSVMGGLAFPKSLGAVHSLSHPLGGLKGKRLHHGTLNALFLPHVLEFNQTFCKEKLERLASIAGVKGGAQLPAFFAKLNEEIGLPARLRDLGVSREELEPLAEKALRDHCSPTNPRPLDLEACRTLYLAAW